MKKAILKKGLVWIVVCVLLVLSVPIVTSTTHEAIPASLSDTQETRLEIIFFGSLRSLLLPGVGYGVDNTGDETAYNVTATFTLEGGLSDSIYFTETWDYTEILPGYTSGRSWLRAIDGFGSVTITVNVEASNAEAVEKTALGFQIGYRTFIFG